MTSFIQGIMPSNNFKFEDVKQPRKLEQRSHLTVEFPQSDNRIFRTYIPFLENPEISESGSNSLQEYNLMGRAGSLYSYGGSESRAIDITFNISLLHLIHLNTTEGIADKFTRHFNLFFADKESAKERFNLRSDLSTEIQAEEDGMANSMAMDGHLSRGVFEDRGDIENKLSDMGKSDTKFNPEGFPHAQTHRKFYSKWLKQITGQNTVQGWITSLEDNVNKDFGAFGGLNPFYTGGNQNRRDLDKLINLVFVWVNLIRATCLNNATNTVQGPPIVRLTHGPMYNNVPCVVRDYSISIMDEAGFDIQTLTPKRLEITMTLSEMRTGDFGTFESGYLESGDNLAGWEAIIGDNNIDPYNGDITEEGTQIGQND
tara:strand:- start:25448 stop:26563 length:1116 start_codon:yes stop_codon:yes gene_type:complete